MLYAVPVGATIANGKLSQTRHRRGREDARRESDLSPREHRKDFPLVMQPGFDGICEERRPPFEDDVIRYYGQYIALAVAETFETAKAAADAVRATYSRKSRTSSPS